MDLLGQWLKVSLYCNSWLCVCERLSGSLFLLCLQSDLSGLQGGETEGERGRETTPVAGRQQLPTSWPGVLTPHLTSMGTERSPLLSWLTVGTRRDLHFPHSRCSWLGHRARGQRRTWQDRTAQLWERDLKWESRALRISPPSSDWTSLAPPGCRSGSDAVV